MFNSLNHESLGKEEVPVDVIIPTFDQELGVLVEVGRSLGPNSNEFVAPDNPELRRLIQIRNPSPNDLSRIHKLIKDNGLYDPSMFAEAAQIYNGPEFKERFQHAVDFFKILNRNWSFFIPERYGIQLTRWGHNGISGGLSGICRIRVNPDGSLPEKDNPAQIPIHESIHTGLKLIIGPLKNNNIISRWENESCVRAIQSTIPGFPEHADNYSELKLRHPTPIDQFLADPIRVVVDFPRCISEFVSWKNQR